MRRLFLFLFILIGFFVMYGPSHGIASGTERETELFNKGYEYLFSYKPDKAAETFRTFLKEFPDSSARDAAMFWLGKTLISMKLYSEAELTFQAIQKEFPDSPFIAFIEIEMKEIIRVRSAESGKDPAKAADLQKDIVSKQSAEKKTGAPDSKPAQPADEIEKIEALLAEERRTNHDHQLRIADLESREAQLRKQKDELEARITGLSELEKKLKDATDERDRLITRLAQMNTVKSRQEKDVAEGGQTGGLEKIIDSGSGEAMRLRLSQLEVLTEDQGKELSRAREEQEHLKQLIAAEKKSSAELKNDLTRSKEREQEFKTVLARTEEKQKSSGEKADGSISSLKEQEKMTAEIQQLRGQVSQLDIDKKMLSEKVADMELQAEQRIRDMKILNSYLTRLMFDKKEPGPKKPDVNASIEKDQLKASLNEEMRTSAELRKQLADMVGQRTAGERTAREGLPLPQPAASPIVRILDREYSLSQIIDYQANALLTVRRMGIEDPVWRVNNPLDDFLTEELLGEAAKKANMTVDAKKQKEMIERYKLSPEEASYLERIMRIGRYIDTRYVDVPSQQWIDVLSVEYKPGNAALKTVRATDLQKAARENISFKEIARKYPDGLKFFRLTPQEFSTRFKDKSQILQKLNFMNEETVVMWSDRGYMLIKPISSRTPFNPLEDLTPERKQRLQAFLLQHIAELRKSAAN